ncbi:MAG: nucleoside kinase [Alloprevotella sp.]|nr:nucleoside kinase [Alloprevotella sp.]MDY6297784.1 nucleoside kinase [Alloprevotella sp.]
MLKTVNIRCKNTGRTHKVPVGFTLEDFYDMIELNMPYGTTSAKVNNKVEGLHYTIFGDKDVEFLDVTSSSGMRTYTRSLFFVLYKALSELFPGTSLQIDTPVANGYYCRIDGLAEGVTTEVVDRLRAKMKEIVGDNIPYHRITTHREDAVRLFREHGLEDKALLLEGSGDLYATYYTLGDTVDYFYGSLLVSTGQIHLFEIQPYADGLLLRLPDPNNPNKLQPLRKQPKMFSIFEEQHRWQKILGVSTIGEFNKVCEQGHTIDLINVSEALQEKKISALADRIASEPDRRVVLIAGPSSSGKTTFAKRLAVQLFACGKKPVSVELDNYFVDREKTPRDAEGNYDFEHIKAMNMKLLSKQMNALLRGEEVELPRFDFPSGRSLMSGTRLKLSPESIVIFEGIHALNPMLTKEVPEENKFRIYASALTTIMLDHHNYIPTTDNRLLRRIVRDYKYRGYSAEETIRRWPSVRAGEEKWIFPFQEEADVMVNTALLFELPALRRQALRLLEQVPESAPEFSEAHRLRKFLSYLRPIDIEPLPPTSLLREFLGGSTFTY